MPMPMGHGQVKPKILVGGMESREKGIVKYLGEGYKKERIRFSFILFGRKKMSNLIRFIIILS